LQRACDMPLLRSRPISGASARGAEARPAIQADKMGRSQDAPTPQRAAAAAKTMQKHRAFQAIIADLFNRFSVSSATRSYSFATPNMSCFDCSSCIESATTRASSARLRQYFGLAPTTLSAFRLFMINPFAGWDFMAKYRF
jgi:hypothetical protein